MSENIIIADASPLIAFGRLDKISLLAETLGKIIITDTVAKECLVAVNKPGAHAIQHAIRSKTIMTHLDPDTNSYEYLFEILDNGEVTAIVLALKLHAKLLIDERIGRDVARKENIKIIGTAGVLLLAKQKKIIKKISPLLHELKDAGYYFSAELVNEILKRANEVK